MICRVSYVWERNKDTYLDNLLRYRQIVNQRKFIFLKCKIAFIKWIHFDVTYWERKTKKSNISYLSPIKYGKVKILDWI